MKRFSNVNDAIKWLETQVRFKGEKDLGLLKKSFELLNIDLSNMKKIHIGGTNGKGSTSAFINSALIDHNLNVGMFTSPYLVKFNERIKFNNKDISDEELIDLINYFYDFNDELFTKINFKLSFFELLTLMALKYFYDKKCDVIIMEIGIGGRLDSTTILNYDITAITNVGYDHMKILGNTLEEIANEKIGALKDNGHLVSTVDNIAKEIFIERAKILNATYKIIDKSLIKPINNNLFYYDSKLFELNMIGNFQRENASLAYEVVKYLFKFSDEAIIKAFKNTYWPGRLEQIRPKVYLDGAHNKPGIEALFNSIDSIFKDKKVKIIFSALKDKDIREMLSIINSQNVDEIILTSFPDFRFESLESFTTDKIKYVEDAINLINSVDNDLKEDEVLLITGSLHFIGYIKSNL